MISEAEILFKTPELEAQFNSPVFRHGARAVLRELSWMLHRKGLPPPFVTDIVRSIKTQYAIYGDKLRFSWHLYGCAFDLRVSTEQGDRYTPAEVTAILDWLRYNFPDCEILLHGQPGTKGNLHIHVGWRVPSFYTTFKEQIRDGKIIA